MNRLPALAKLKKRLERASSLLGWVRVQQTLSKRAEIAKGSHENQPVPDWREGKKCRRWRQMVDAPRLTRTGPETQEVSRGRDVRQTRLAERASIRAGGLEKRRSGDCP